MDYKKLVDNLHLYPALYDELKDSLDLETRYYIESGFEDSTVKDETTEEMIARVYKEYHRLVNMSASQVKAWKENPCSAKASLGRGAINRNIRILETPRNEWTASTAKSANRTISFISRMRGAEQGEHVSKECKISKRDISLKNWAYNP